MIYYVRETGSWLVKIGSAKDPRQRLKELQTGCPARLQLLAVAPGDSRVERHLHHQQRHWRVRGEWFRMNDHMARAIAMAHPEFARLAVLEPMLPTLAGTLGMMMSEQDTPNWVWMWHGRRMDWCGIKDLLSEVVGWGRSDQPAGDERDELHTSHAYDVVYEVFFRLLADAPECDYVVPVPWEL